jgi:uncharacterized lipoprotein NlpE involved in copper resistance
MKLLKLTFILFILVLTGCDNTNEGEMVKILEDMVLNASGNVITEEAYCNTSQYADYFSDNLEGHISCDGENGYYDYITKGLLKYYNSTNQVKVKFDIEDDIVTYYIVENDVKFILAITSTAKPFIIIGIE